MVGARWLARRGQKISDRDHVLTISSGARALVLTLAVALLAGGCAGRRDAILRRDVDAVVGDGSFSGVVMVARHGRPLVAHAVGLADRALKTPMTLRTGFVVGSLAKQMTAALVLRAVDAGRLTLDARARDFVPELADARVTVAQLLDHTSGLVAIDRPPRTPPGSAFAYTNLEYELLGRIVEKAASAPFAQLAAQLFERCGMRDSDVLAPLPWSELHERMPSLAVGYDERPDGVLAADRALPERISPPAGGIVSTAPDLLRWNHCLHETSLLSPASYRAMITPAPAAVRAHRWGALGYGLGLQVSARDGLVEYSHGGYLPGYEATLIRLPRARVDVVVLENVSRNPDDLPRAFRVADTIRARVRRAQ
jgi:CubicO group peptidase (beta-lactamase class C family)